MATVVLLDNGAGKVKASVLTSDDVDGAGADADVHVKWSNCTARMNKQMNVAGLVGDEVDSYVNGSLLQYMRPFERGYLTNWPCEVDVWNRVFGKAGLHIKPTDSTLLLTEAPFTPEPLQNDANEVIFEVRLVCLVGDSASVALADPLYLPYILSEPYLTPI